MTPRVWFKSISLENVRSFGTKQTINFTDKNGNAAQWNVILGDNGTGKTTVLRSLVLSIIEKYKTGWRPYEQIALFRKSHTKLEISSVIDYQGEERLAKLILYYSDKDMAAGRFPYSEHQHEPNEYAPLLFAYGATRRIGETEISKVKNDKVESIFNESASLINAEEWLIQAEFSALKREYRNDDRLKTIKLTLLNLFKNEIFDIQSEIIKINESEVPKVYFKTNYGQVLLHELSLGYKTLIAWVVDFAKGLFDSYSHMEYPLEEPAICLVDEIDLHLHPKFQRNIIQFLTETFPNTQFIVTAHSPLIVQSAEEQNANIILLKREGDETVVVNDPVDVRNWRLDQILSSELFGIEDKTLQMRRERDKLLAKTGLNEMEQARLETLNEELNSVPFSSDPAEIKAETIIYELAEALRNRM